MRRRRIFAGAVAAAAVLAAGGAVAVQAASTVHLQSKPHGYAFNVKVLHATHGKVTVVMANTSSRHHGIAVEGHGVDKDGKTVGKGKSSSVTVTLKKGTYEFYCPVPGHKALGMKGTLIVK